MRTHFERPAPVPMRIGVIAVCLLAALGLAAIARAIPTSYAGIPVAAQSGQRASAGGGDDAQALLVPATPPIDGRKQARCPECGVIESIRMFERSSAAGGQSTAAIKVSEGESGGAIAAHAVAGKGYETTVRLRDGSTAVFNEATPRAWRPGSRVMVIGALQVANR
jgi:hypothetical protein